MSREESGLIGNLSNFTKDFRDYRPFSLLGPPPKQEVDAHCGVGAGGTGENAHLDARIWHRRAHVWPDTVLSRFASHCRSSKVDKRMKNESILFEAHRSNLIEGLHMVQLRRLLETELI